MDETRHQNARNEYSWIREREAKNKQYYDRDDGLASLPHTICLTVNNNCFMRCRMCDVGASNRKSTFDLEDSLFTNRYKNVQQYTEFPLQRIKDLIDELGESTIIKTNLIEPLLYSHIEEVAKYAKSMGLRYYTITNGWLLKKNALWLVEAGVDLVRVSLDGVPDVHDSIRGVKGSYQRTVDGLRELIRQKQIQGMTNPVLGVCYTISDANYDHLLEFMRCMERENLLEHVYVNFNHLMFTTPWEVDETMAFSQEFSHLAKSTIDHVNIAGIKTEILAEQIDLVEAHYRKCNHFYFTPGLKAGDLHDYYKPDARMFPRVPCYLPWYTAQVDINGEVNVYGRCILPSFGNIMDRSFESVWNSEKAREIRRNLKQAGSYPGCNRCIGTLYPLRGRD